MEFDPRTKTRNEQPDGLVLYKFNEEQKVKLLRLGTEKEQQKGLYIYLANNAY